MYRTLIVIAVLLATLLTPAWAKPKAVVFVVGSTRLTDLTSPGLPNFKKILTDGSVGLMNARTAGTPKGETSSSGYESACLTIGAGTRAAGGTFACRAYNSQFKLSELTAAQVWSSRMLLAEPKAEVIQPSVVRIIEDNKDEKYSITVGALGESLHRAGLKTAVVGNADTQEDLHREAADIAMDQDGLVDYGEVENRLDKSDPKAPFGLSADVDAYNRALDRVWPLADFIVVDPGDTLRADLYSASCTVPQAANLRKQAVRNADLLLGDVMRRMDFSRDMLVVVSPNFVREAMKDGQILAPVMIAGPGYPKGILTSSSTKWRGIVTNADLAPSILSFFDIKAPRSMVGRSAYTLKTESALSEIAVTEHKLALRNQQQPISRWIAFVNAAIILISTLGLIWLRKRNTALKWLVLCPAASVLTALCLPVLGIWGLWQTALAIIVLPMALAALALLLWRDSLKAFTAICLTLSTTLVCDLVLKTGLLRQSVLSYSASEGARYYGMGNEYMGAAIGATMTAVGLFLYIWNINPRLRQAIAVLALGVMTMAISAPFLGANTGGAMSVVPAALVALRLRTGRKFKLTHMLGIALSIVAAVTLLILVDSLRGNGQSHIGRFGSAVASGGIQQFLLVIERKLAMNFTLLASSPWSRLMMVSAAAFAALWFDAKTGIASFVRKSPELSAGIIASLVGAGAAFAFNDSGVVAAAICLVYPWSALALLAINTDN